jgi:hypothetical protein
MLLVNCVDYLLTPILEKCKCLIQQINTTWRLPTNWAINSADLQDHGASPPPKHIWNDYTKISIRTINECVWTGTQECNDPLHPSKSVVHKFRKLSTLSHFSRWRIKWEAGERGRIIWSGVDYLRFVIRICKCWRRWIRCGGQFFVSRCLHFHFLQSNYHSNKF